MYILFKNIWLYIQDLHTVLSAGESLLWQAQLRTGVRVHVQKPSGTAFRSNGHGKRAAHILINSAVCCGPGFTLSDVLQNGFPDTFAAHGAYV